MKINNYRKFKVVIITIIAVIFLFALWYFLKTNVNGQAQETEIEAVSTEPETKKIIIPINVGDTYGVIMEKEELRELNSEKLYAAAKEYYDLAQIRAGYSLELICDYQSGKAQELIYKIDGQEQLSIKIEGENYTATIMPIPYETRIVSKKGNISSSLYEAALEKEIDERAIIALADAFQWSIDFAMDPRVGDTFKFIYEEKYLDDEYIRPGKILAGKYVNSGKEYYVFYFDGEKDNEGYFDEEGNSVQKLFLKAPVAFKYISSGFTTGLRYVEAFNVSTGHRAIDYAAPSGTPIRSVGDGTITMAGWNGSYGYMVSVRHNGTYSTNYAHMSKMAVKKGAKVKQGDIIGYVGSTGFSTGPHLHYEMVKNGIKINPLTEVLPPGKSLNEEIKIIFLEKIKEYKEDLNKN